MALLDPYGLTLVSVELWGVLWGVLSFGFIIGAGWVSRKGLGAAPCARCCWPMWACGWWR